MHLIVHSLKPQSLSEGEVVDAAVTADDGATVDVHQVALLGPDVMLYEVLEAGLLVAPPPDKAVI